jgi:hypothetical protein
MTRQDTFNKMMKDLPTGMPILDKVLTRVQELEQQLASREKQVVMLREALLYMHDEKCNYMRLNHLGDPLKETAARIALKALAATQDLSSLVPCEAEPIAWMNPYGGVLPVLSTGLEKSTYTIPLYMRKQP